MSALLSSVTVTPGWSQIAVQDFDTSDAPEWHSGDERLAWLPGCFLIGTIDDTDGDVLVELKLGEIDVPNLQVILEATFICKSGVVSVNTPAMDHEETLLLPRRGDWKIRIAVRDKEQTDYVAVYFDEEEWSAALR